MTGSVSRYFQNLMHNFIQIGWKLSKKICLKLRQGPAKDRPKAGALEKYGRYAGHFHSIWREKRFI